VCIFEINQQPDAANRWWQMTDAIEGYFWSPNRAAIADPDMGDAGTMPVYMTIEECTN